MCHVALRNYNSQCNFTSAYTAFGSQPIVAQLCNYICNCNNYSYIKKQFVVCLLQNQTLISWGVSVLGERWVYLVALQSSKIHHVVTLFGHQGHQLNCFLQDRNCRPAMSIHERTLWTEVYVVYGIYTYSYRIA